MHLASAAWPAIPTGWLLAVPLGSTEQHGPHLPLDTDTRIATALATGLAQRRPDVLVGPAMPYTASGEHAGFPGTLSIGTEVLQSVLVEIIRSADATARGVVLVNAHGGNLTAVNGALDLLRAEGRRALHWSPRAPWPHDLHAGRLETSLLLHLAPELVRPADAAAGPVPAIADLARYGVRALSPTGVLGDPAGANAELGARVLDGWVDELAVTVAAWEAA